MASRFNQRAFTLIELSLVLVIIALLVGAIVVGKEMIYSAAVRAQATQFTQINSAVNAFRIKYGYVPGDLTLAQINQFGFYNGMGCVAGGYDRCNNGFVDASASNTLPSWAFFRLLRDSGMMDCPGSCDPSLYDFVTANLYNQMFLPLKSSSLHWVVFGGTQPSPEAVGFSNFSKNYLVIESSASSSKLVITRRCLCAGFKA